MYLIDRRFFRYFDWITAGLLVLLSIIGLVFVYSATYKPELPYSLFFKKQMLGLCGAIIIFFACSCINYKTIMRWGYFGYLVCLLALAFTLIKGSIGMGGQRWINLGIFKVQPSELTKLLFPTAATFYFYTQRDVLACTFTEFLPLLSLLAIGCLLILKQPDLGTALVILFSGLTILWLAGLSRWFFSVLAVVSIIGSPLLWHTLKPYQQQRILVFLGYGERRKERYQIEQSQIAIGSGGLYGKGFLQGTQNKLHFLPEGRTDFIFSVMCEEIGFCGVLVILFVYLLLFARCFVIIGTVHSPFAQLLAAGLLLPVLFSALINIAMVTGLLPAVGIPLPLISYGLCNLWVTFAAFGVFNAISMSRFYVT